MRLIPRRVTLSAAAAGGVITLLVGAVPLFHFAYRSRTTHVALDSAEAVIATCAAYLIFGRFRQRGGASDGLLSYGLGVLALTNLLFSIAPLAAGDEREGVWLWAALLARLIGAATFAAAAVLPGRTVAARWRRARFVPLALAATMLAVAAIAAGLSAAVADVGVTPPAQRSARPVLTGHPVIYVFQGLNLALYTAAAVWFTRRAERTGDELTMWLGAGAALAAWARVNYLLFPSLYSEYVYTGDVLRLGFYLVLLVAATEEIRRYWQDLALAAVAEERRRMARDLHDGLAQELAFIVGRATDLRARGDPELAHVAAAAERAFDESRRAIHALTTTADESLEVALARAAEDVARRVGTEVRFDLEAGVQVAPQVRETLVRIVREAVTNAARHGGAGRVRVELTNREAIRLVVSDDGRGFRPEQTLPGFGLVSMRERADAVGGHLSVASEPGKGTTVEMTLA